jgi:hypothetical protein
LPSSAFARRVAQIGSTSTPAAVMRVVILSAYSAIGRTVQFESLDYLMKRRTVISIPSSARINAAYVAASSEEA